MSKAKTFKERKIYCRRPEEPNPNLSPNPKSNPKERKYTVKSRRNLNNTEDISPLWRAAERGLVSMVEMLLKDQKDQVLYLTEVVVKWWVDGVSPFNVAEMGDSPEHEKCALLLEEVN